MSSKSSEIEEVKWCHLNGKLHVQYFKKDGVMHGEYKEYNKNGELCQHRFFKDGEHYGECIRYYKDGSLCVHSFYKDGKHHGEYKRYRDNGELDEHCFFYNDANEALSEYVDDINNITDTDFMNLSMVFGINFIASKTFIGAAS